MRLTVDLYGADTVAGDLRAYGARGDDLRPALEEVADDWLGLQLQVFASDGAVLGRRWTPLSPDYLKDRLRDGRGSQILRLQGGQGGRLYRALTRRGSPWQIRRVTPDGVTVGTNLGIAAAHQHGDRRERLPARPYVPPERLVRIRWATILQRHINGEDR